MRKKRIKGLFTDKEWKEKKRRYDFHCVYCGRKLKKLTRDHLMALSIGGTNFKENIVPACKKCNSRKEDEFTHIFLKHLNYKKLYFFEKKIKHVSCYRWGEFGEWFRSKRKAYIEAMNLYSYFLSDGGIKHRLLKTSVRKKTWFIKRNERML